MSETAPPPSILAVVAHPDDESLACGATLARARALGARTAVLTLTRGEAGASPDAHGLTPLSRRRSEEFLAAARLLGGGCAMLRSHPDGLLPWVDAAALAADIRRGIAIVDAGIVITFGADGLYWHPDHIAVWERTAAVVAALGAGAPALYCVTMPPGQMRRVAEADPKRRPVVPGLFDADAFGAAAAPPTLVVRCGRFARVKLAAIRAHRSQFGASAFAAIRDHDVEALLDVEHFHRAPVGARGPTFLDTLADAPPAGHGARA